MIEQFAQHVGTRTGLAEVREMELKLVRPGMTILQDVRTHMGTLLVPRGFEVTNRFLERIGNLGASLSIIARNTAAARYTRFCLEPERPIR